MSKSEFKIHPAADLFPMMTPSRLDEMAQDIGANGQRFPVMIWRGQVIDGRNRLKACELAGQNPWTQKCDKDFASEEQVIRYIISVNLQRRNLSTSVRAALAVELLPMLKEEAKERQRQGIQKIEDPKAKGAAVEKAAEITGTNRQYVHDAAKLKDEAPEKFEEVRRGETSIPQAMRSVRRRSIDANVSEESRLIDDVIAKLTAATKKLRKCVDNLGVSTSSIKRVKDALFELQELVP
jgi:hypothetical protein